MGNIVAIHTDGGSRGNPGPAACAFVAEEDGVVVHKAAFYLGKATNNVAEYTGVIKALDWILSSGGKFTKKEIVFYLDSELIVRQILGIYRVKDLKLKSLYDEVTSLIKKTTLVINFKNIPREKNKEADYLLNKELDSNA